uniref:Uncharacterized protein n=1 Tax=Rhizophora mucronata TaxID=61149 RepID=A0A2P2QUW2_RHIMU
MPKLPSTAVHILGNNGLHRRVSTVVQSWKYGLRTITRHREPTAIVSIRLSQCLGKESRLLLRLNPIDPYKQAMITIIKTTIYKPKITATQGN